MVRGLNKYVVSWGVDTNASAHAHVPNTSQGSKPDPMESGNKFNKPFNFIIINLDKSEEHRNVEE